MSAVTRPRGPLPARVYWTRRLLISAVALALVLGVARLLGGGGGGQAPAATPVAASESATPSVSQTPTGSAVPSETPTPTATAATASPRRATSSALAQPTGTCPSGDVVATPTVKHHAYAGHPVVFELLLTTRQSPACTWSVSAGSLAVKVVQETSGSSTSTTPGEDRIWTTQQCRGAVPRQSVVLRPDVPATVDIAWNGHRSDSGCTLSTDWIEPGLYHVVTAAYGSDPVDKAFSLVLAPVTTVTATPRPTASRTAKAHSKRSTSTSKASASPTASASTTARATPSG